MSRVSVQRTEREAFSGTGFSKLLTALYPRTRARVLTVIQTGSCEPAAHNPGTLPRLAFA